MPNLTNCYLTIWLASGVTPHQYCFITFVLLQQKMRVTRKNVFMLISVWWLNKGKVQQKYTDPMSEKLALCGKYMNMVFMNMFLKMWKLNAKTANLSLMLKSFSLTEIRNNMRFSASKKDCLVITVFLECQNSFDNFSSDTSGDSMCKVSGRWRLNCRRSPKK